MDDDEAVFVVPRWAWPVTLLLTLVGIGVATYLTIAHFDTHVALVCSDKGTINCAKVTTSAQSKLFGIPVAVLGLAYFVFMIPWVLPRAWRSADPRVRFGRLVLCLAGVGFVGYLVYAEVVLIKAICLWCTVVHAVTLVIFAITAFATALSYWAYADEPDETDGTDGTDTLDAG